MPPLTTSLGALAAFEINDSKKQENVVQRILKQSDKFKFKTEIIWKNVFMFSYFHAFALYGLYLYLFVGTWKTFIWTTVLIELSMLGMTAGIHRLWAHRTYKANLPLRILLMLLQTMAFQKTIYDWARDHRVHHKYTHTDADPHNPERGHFYAHIGSLFLKKHKDVMIKGAGIDLSDLENDPVVKFQKRHWWSMVMVLAFIFPGVVPWYFWGESLLVCAFTPTFFRFVYVLHLILLINSLAHAYGTKPYDKNIGPVDNAFVSFVASGEGWHNFHHTFPWDYKTGEYGKYTLNGTTMFIDFFAAIGWAYDLKTVSPEVIKKRMKRTGDSNAIYQLTIGNDYSKQERLPWGWDDVDLKDEEKESAKIYNKLQE